MGQLFLALNFLMASWMPTPSSGLTDDWRHVWFSCQDLRSAIFQASLISLSKTVFFSLLIYCHLRWFIEIFWEWNGCWISSKMRNHLKHLETTFTSSEVDGACELLGMAWQLLKMAKVVTRVPQVLRSLLQKEDLELEAIQEARKREAARNESMKVSESQRIEEKQHLPISNFEWRLLLEQVTCWEGCQRGTEGWDFQLDNMNQNDTSKAPPRCQRRLPR